MPHRNKFAGEKLREFGIHHEPHLDEKAVWIPKDVPDAAILIFLPDQHQPEFVQIPLRNLVHEFFGSGLGKVLTKTV
jgi:hypothetical protein